MAEYKETVRPTFNVSLYIAGDYHVALDKIRDLATLHSICVTVSKTEYVYKYGQESGVVVGFRIHPWYPDSTPDRLVALARQFAIRLMWTLHQRTCTIVTPTETILLERVEE